MRRLPHGEGASERDFRDAALWRESDLTGLQEAALDLGETPAEWAADAVRNLRWLGYLCTEIQDTDPRSGYSFRDFLYQEWGSRRQRAYKTSIQDASTPWIARPRATAGSSHGREQGGSKCNGMAFTPGQLVVIEVSGPFPSSLVPVPDLFFH